MKIAIISDVHDNTVNLAKVIEYVRKKNVHDMICCGDLTSMETLNFINDNFDGQIYYSFGNADNDQLRSLENVEEYKNTEISPEFGTLEFDGKEVAFVHFPEDAKELAKTGKFNFVFHGHTHKPWEEMEGECKILNPGNVAGVIYPPTFAIWNTKENSFELVRIHEI